MCILTPRQIEVLRAMLGGKTTKQIARDLDIAEVTVRIHISDMCRLTNQPNRVGLAVWAITNLPQEPANDTNL